MLVTVFWGKNSVETTIIASDTEHQKELDKYKYNYIKTTEKAFERAKVSLKSYVEKTWFWKKVKIVFLLDKKFNYLSERVKEIEKEVLYVDTFKEDLHRLLTVNTGMKLVSSKNKGLLDYYSSIQ